MAVFTGAGVAIATPFDENYNIVFAFSWFNISWAFSFILLSDVVPCV